MFYVIFQDMNRGRPWPGLTWDVSGEKGDWPTAPDSFPWLSLLRVLGGSSGSERAPMVGYCGAWLRPTAGSDFGWLRGLHQRRKLGCEGWRCDGGTSGDEDGSVVWTTWVNRSRLWRDDRRNFGNGGYGGFDRRFRGDKLGFGYLCRPKPFRQGDWALGETYMGPNQNMMDRSRGMGQIKFMEKGFGSEGRRTSRNSLQHEHWTAQTCLSASVVLIWRGKNFNTSALDLSCPYSELFSFLTASCCPRVDLGFVEDQKDIQKLLESNTIGNPPPSLPLISHNPLLFLLLHLFPTLF
ncbi:hypothetical protein TEA_020282 [Camellia sinensis var. sinensis]|uniref:Uncharacterized protein n=1 Tax=Camellia sinensis var. sinensis TaxID=542762 RepID=A0A4S4ED07_CAMSN|nr:hypothetical protein TEA_020282 [Camellia sinensis var. sinensis]